MIKGPSKISPAACESVNVMLKSASALTSSSRWTSIGIAAPSAGAKNCPTTAMKKMRKYTGTSALLSRTSVTTKPKLASARKALLIQSTKRLSNRSTKTPAGAPKSAAGRLKAAMAPPVAVTDLLCVAMRMIMP